MSPTTAPRHLVFEPTAEIFASDSTGAFFHELRIDRDSFLDTATFDEIRFVVSIWHPTRQRTIDFDSAYVELVCRWDPAEARWVKLAELEPVIPPYNAGETFDGWIVLPVLAARTAYALAGSGFAARSQLQVRASAYLVA